MYRANYFFVLVITSTFLAIAGCRPTALSPTQQGDWVESAQLGGVPRTNAVCFVIGNTAYVGLGWNGSSGNARLNDFWSFNVDSGWRQQLSQFPGPARSNAVGFSVGNFGYVGTGTDALKSYRDFYQYDPIADKWTPKDSLPGDARYDAVGFGLQGKGYIGTGYSSYWLNDFYEYDPQADKWKQTIGTAGDLSKRRGAVAFTYHNKAYIVTGSTSGSMTRDFWSFDPSQASPWVRLGNIVNDNISSKTNGYTDIQRELAVAFVNGDSAYLVLGQNGTFVPSTWVYDFVHDQWGRRAPYHRQLRSGAVAFTVRGRSFVGTGSPGSGAVLDDFDEFLPNQPYNPTH